MLCEKDFRMTGEFKAFFFDGTCFIGKNRLDVIAFTIDGEHWKGLKCFPCELCENGEPFVFNELLLQIVQKTKIPLYLYSVGDYIYIRYDDEKGNSNLYDQLAALR